MSFSVSSTILQGWTVMVVDDEPDSLEVASILLRRCGATVLTAENGKQGFETAAKNRLHFILADLSMPEVNGWDMISKLKKNPATKDVPVIALTAHAMPGDREAAFGAGFHNYLSKPLVPETFVRDVLNLLMDIPDIAQALKADSAAL
jgi:two-component system, cell cycle response regulator DivK